MATQIDKKPDARKKKSPPKGLSLKTRAAITSAVLENLIQPKDMICLTRLTAGAGVPPLYTEAGYCDEKLIDVCRMVAMGLGETSAARAVGVSPETFKKWKEQIPGVADEIARAKYLAAGAVAWILRKLMTSSNEMVALRAAEFFLKSRTKEFREKQDVEVEIDASRLQKQIRQDLYGQRGDPAELAKPKAIEHEAIEHEAIEHEAIEHEAIEHEAEEAAAVAVAEIAPELIPVDEPQLPAVPLDPFAL